MGLQCQRMFASVYRLLFCTKQKRSQSGCVKRLSGNAEVIYSCTLKLIRSIKVSHFKPAVIERMLLQVALVSAPTSMSPRGALVDSITIQVGASQSSETSLKNYSCCSKHRLRTASFLNFS